MKSTQTKVVFLCKALSWQLGSNNNDGHAHSAAFSLRLQRLGYSQRLA